jgi:5-methylcytosine-specific restriction protein A
MVWTGVELSLSLPTVHGMGLAPVPYLFGGEQHGRGITIPDNFYKTGVWVRKRVEILERDNHECQRCKRNGGYAKAECVHHIKPLEQYPELALVDENLESLCFVCHNIEHPEKLRTPEASKRRQITPERW